MTDAEKLFNVLANARTQKGGVLTKEQWLETAQMFLDTERPLKATKKKPTSQMTDAEWLTHLEAEPSLAGVDVRRELGRAQFWCNESNRKCNRRFFVNWLGKAERTVTTPGAGKTSRPRIDPNLNEEPAGWYFVALKKWGATAAAGLKEKGWKAMDTYYKTEIVRLMI